MSDHQPGNGTLSCRDTAEDIAGSKKLSAAISVVYQPLSGREYVFSLSVWDGDIKPIIPVDNDHHIYEALRHVDDHVVEEGQDLHLQQ